MPQYLNSKVLNWLESISVDPDSEKDDPSAIEQPRKRAKLSNSRAPYDLLQPSPNPLPFQHPKPPSGFNTASFKHDPQPDSLKRLCSSLELIHAGFGILPKTLRESLIDEDDVFEWMFSDEPQFGCHQLPTIWAAREIWRMAARCDGPKKLPESAWNNDVHSRVLDWVFRNGSASNGLLDYRCCFNAAILPEYQPESSPTKMVDYCVCFQPEDSSPEYARIEQLCRQGRPGQSINHTDWGDLVSYPIGISIETKGPGISYDTALVQVATWHAAQWRSIFHNRERHSVTESSRRIPFLPGIIVVKHDWYFVATDRDGMGKARTFEKKTLGSTESLLGIYKLVMALQKLARWLVDEFWPAFQADVLSLESDI
ncbi:hypothetical protein F66182_888 [Fusarium sp. NRRL 66182]|nr:hypothetical protein F66182_888 [Fusarium sp. NRRL 66182]